MKNRNLIRPALTLIALTWLITGKAQTASNKINDRNWHELYKTSQVEINYKYSECSLPEAGTQEESAYLQFRNLTNKKMNFTWSPTLWYGDRCYNCDGVDPEMTYTITLEAGEVKEGTCSMDCPRSLKIFGKYLNVVQEGPKRELKDFDLKSPKVVLID